MVPVQFYQLWTIFISVARHTVPAIHCFMTARSQELYSCLLERLVRHLPEFKPVTSLVIQCNLNYPDILGLLE